jgi:hypothetical protein
MDLLLINFEDAEGTISLARKQIDQAKIISMDIQAEKYENPELESSLNIMFEIADTIINRANAAYLTRKIMRGARATRNIKGGKRRRNKSKKNRRNYRK